MRLQKTGMEDGEWREENGERRMKDGGWRMKNGDGGESGVHINWQRVTIRPNVVKLRPPRSLVGASQAKYAVFAVSSVVQGPHKTSESRASVRSFG